jgi:hypothetical protein
MQIKVTDFVQTLILVAGLTVSALAKSASDESAGPTKSAGDLVSVTNQYKKSVESLIPIYDSALKTATEALEKRQELFAKGLISKRDLEAGEQAVKEAQAQLDQTRRQIAESDQMIAEALAEQQTARIRTASRVRSSSYTTGSVVTRFSGSSGWTLARAGQVHAFFTSTFGRPLPISAHGQTGTHNRLGFDHRQSIDVAVHPDSAEGKALMTYLRSKNIPFLAFRSAVSGQSTGAHIHIGYPSHRLR